jgi:hypothetical protein
MRIAPASKGPTPMANPDDANPSDQDDRRTFMTRMAYVTPAVLTLKAVPSFASYGSSPGPTDSQGQGQGLNPRKEKDKDKGEKREKSKKNK